MVMAVLLPAVSNYNFELKCGLNLTHSMYNKGGDYDRDWAQLLSLPNKTSMEALSRAGGTWVKSIMLEVCLKTIQISNWFAI